MLMLKCSNTECESLKTAEGEDEDQTPMFTVKITVGSEYESAEPIRKIPLEYFICVYCNCSAGGE